jgi:hypothetical protein
LAEGHIQHTVRAAVNMAFDQKKPGFNEVNDEQKLVCHCSRKSRVFRTFGRALLAGRGLRKTWSRAVLSLLEMNGFSRQAVAHSPVIYRLSEEVLLSSAGYRDSDRIASANAL